MHQIFSVDVRDGAGGRERESGTNDVARVGLDILDDDRLARDERVGADALACLLSNRLAGGTAVEGTEEEEVGTGGADRRWEEGRVEVEAWRHK